MDNNTKFLTDRHVPLRLSLLKGKNEKSHKQQQAPITIHFTSIQRVCVVCFIRSDVDSTQVRSYITYYALTVPYYSFFTFYLSMNKYPPSTQTISFLLSSFYLCFVSRYSLSSSFLFLKVLLFLLIICMSIEKSFKLFNT
jgi:hypothetical protein